MSVANRSATAAAILEQRIRWYGRMAAGRARRAARLALATVGLPVSREFLVLDCPDGDEASGLFSEVAAVIGCAAEVESHPRLYTGMRVDFGRHGLYYDAAAGPNWWEYYFEPLSIGNPGAVLRPAADWEHDAFAETVELAMPHDLAAAVLRRHVRVRPALLEEVDRYWSAQSDGAFVVGVHYRGTDKWEGAPIVPYETVAQAVIDATRAAGGPRWQVFLATDEQACVDFMQRRFPGQVVAREMRRSLDGRPLHKAAGDGFRKGQDAMMDCLLLSRSAQLIRTDSDLGLFATLFNPAMPVRLLGVA